MSVGLLSLAQSIPVFIWHRVVNDTVTEPYLDEVFHVRQAQAYCANHFHVWDPKITTPPGLYLLSYAFSPLFGCETSSLRFLNVLCLLQLFWVVFWTYSVRQPAGKRNAILLAHSAVNVTLLPPLFFFSALYYTDVASTLSVLLFYLFFLWSYRNGTSPWLRDPALVLLGLSSLMFRQTNIFWVAIFPAAIVLVGTLDRGHDVVKESMYRRVEGFGDSMVSVARTSWKMDVVYDVSVRDAWIEDYAKTILSIAVCALKTITKPDRVIAVLLASASYLTILALFSAFVFYNGSVVLGDKSNHVATFHLPQMLYLWPYITFFSWPLLYPYFFALLYNLLAKLSTLAPLESLLLFKRRRVVPRVLPLALFIALACVVVAVNTIVHPFVLADNRHYVFYVFRLLLRPWWVRYAVTPIYIICGWACIQTLGSRPLDMASKATVNQSEQQPRPLTLPDGSTSARISFTLIWLATTAMQLITAPLVEPRYFILPWIFWRIHLPLQQYRPAENSKRPSSELAQLRADFLGWDHRLWLESAWLLGINLATGYIFLNWGFVWPQEPGKVQRFMW